VKPSVFRIVILRLAYGAHFKVFHGGFRPIVGNVADDGIPGAAVGAVDKRIAEPPVFGVEQFFPAGVADGDVRGDERVRRCRVPAGDDRKPFKIVYRFVVKRNPGDPGQGRAFAGKIPGKRFNIVWGPFNMDDYAGRCVGDVAV
jgi:hypothetical protein